MASKVVLVLAGLDLLERLTLVQGGICSDGGSAGALRRAKAPWNRRHWPFHWPGPFPRPGVVAEDLGQVALAEAGTDLVDRDERDLGMRGAGTGHRSHRPIPMAEENLAGRPLALAIDLDGIARLRIKPPW